MIPVTKSWRDFKSHHSGMETVFGLIVMNQFCDTLNRTIVGWKPVRRVLPLPSTGAFKSHHSGMETLPYAPGLGTPRAPLNRTIVGWKLSGGSSHTLFCPPLNRTIVGWKLAKALYEAREDLL